LMMTMRAGQGRPQELDASQGPNLANGEAARRG
jgi:hypothetical protein